MGDSKGFDRERFQAELAIARGQLDRIAQELAHGEDQGRAGDVFGEALRAAGYARALGEPDRAVRALLWTAADAGAMVFRLRGSMLASVTELETMREEVFVDTSMTNQWTFIRALYAALASDAEKSLSYLAGLAAEDYRSEQVEVPPVLDLLCRALSAVVAGDPDAGAAVRGILARREDQPGGEDRGWLLQAGALERLIGHDDAGFRALLADLAEQLEAEADGPARFLQLPILGLEALAARVGRR